MKFIVLFLGWSLITFNAQAQEVECFTGEIFQLPQSCCIRSVQSVKDGSIVYVQDDEGRLHAFEQTCGPTLQKRNICQLPAFGQVYSWFHNTLELGRDPCHPNPWTLANTSSENPTVSIFELINSYPIEIRNRGPQILPWVCHTHHGPLGMVGVDIAAMDKWVVVSGYTPDRRKVFAMRELNNNVTGHNFLMHYTLPKGEWKPNQFYSWLACKLGITQKPFALPIDDWTTYELPEGAEPGVIFRRVPRDKEIQFLLEINLNGGKKQTYFDMHKKEYTTYLPTQPPHYRGKSWPCEEECRFVLAVPEETKRKASLDGAEGFVSLSSKEPFYGVFTNTQGVTTNIYYATRSVWDFLTGNKTFVDEVGASLNLTFS